MNRKIIIPLALGALLTVGGCGGGIATHTETKTVTISGAFALQPLVMLWADKFMETYPDVMFEISGGGAGKGMTDVMMGMSDIAMVSRTVTADEQSKGAVVFPVAKDAVVAIVNVENPYLEQIVARGISRESAHGIWIDKTIRTWGQFLNNREATPLRVFTRFDACGAADTWAAWLGAKQINLAGAKVFGDARVLAAVQKENNTMGYINLAYAYDQTSGAPQKGVVVLPVDVDGNGLIDDHENVCNTMERIVAAIGAGVYPAPPARNLYLVTNGIPKDPAVAEFIRFALTEGQKYNLPAGYVEATSDEIAEAMGLIETR